MWGKSPYLLQICNTCDFTYPTSGVGRKNAVSTKLLFLVSVHMAHRIALQKALYSLFGLVL